MSCRIHRVSWCRKRCWWCGHGAVLGWPSWTHCSRDRVQMTFVLGGFWRGSGHAPVPSSVAGDALSLPGASLWAFPIFHRSNWCVTCEGKNPHSHPSGFGQCYASYSWALKWAEGNGYANEVHQQNWHWTAKIFLIIPCVFSWLFFSSYMGTFYCFGV